MGIAKKLFVSMTQIWIFPFIANLFCFFTFRYKVFEYNNLRHFIVWLLHICMETMDYFITFIKLLNEIAH